MNREAAAPKRRVSVCVPVYNGRDYVEAAVRSVLNQTFQDFELILIDDASTDGSFELLQQFTSDARVRLERNATNLGLEGNWNYCLGLAVGDFIKVFPGDDLLEPHCLEAQVKVLSTRREVALVCGARTIIDSQGRRLGRRGMGRRDLLLSPAATVRRVLTTGTNCLGEPGAVMVRRSHLPQVGGFSTKNFFVVDLDFYLRHLDHGQVAYIAKPLASFRVSAVSASTVFKDRQYTDFRGLIDDLQAEGKYQFPAGVWKQARRMALLNAFARSVFYRFFVKK